MATATEPTTIGQTDIRNAIDDQVEPGSQGKLVEVPRIAVLVDDTDPTVIKIAFSGGIELERGNKAHVEFFNSLAAGRATDAKVDLFVAGAKNSHRRDGEGDVDAIVQTKSLIVTDIHF